VANEAAKGGAASMFGRKTMSIEEARSILGVDAQCTLEDVMGRYAKMFEANEKNGSFYLQSKIHRAKERMEAEFLGEGGGGDGDAGAGDGADAAGDAAKNPNAGRGFAASGVDDDAPKK
jgi:import inner membrane translocase subunit TIM16